ncbi:hypothetical protein LAZ67_8000927 [Cordylochernes scorpioides]|uniref:Uncharacterized protein n=1 Tax=Cordylochernes scorpioides TaxID=51811 RepID=A0ABY6KPS8_9ARAC|nr:hypothetical protein LAZ67_8000927 [Cordylochernes scorpioides]
MHLKRSPAKFLPIYPLTNEQKEHSKETCKNMVEMFNSDPHWLKIVITVDETWVYGYDPETKRQSRFKKTRMIKSKLKCLLIIFFDVKGLSVLETRLAPCVLSTGPTNFDPARSPDLTPLDFFLWGTVKDEVYKRKPRNLDILWNEIQAVCREISLDVLIRCTESVEFGGSHGSTRDGHAVGAPSPGRRFYLAVSPALGVCRPRALHQTGVFLPASLLLRWLYNGHHSAADPACRVSSGAPGVEPARLHYLRLMRPVSGLPILVLQHRPPSHPRGVLHNREADGPLILDLPDESRGPRHYYLLSGEARDLCFLRSSRNMRGVIGDPLEIYFNLFVDGRSAMYIY